MISSAIYSFMAATAGITALVSTRIYPLVMPVGHAWPAITYNGDDHNLVQTFDGQTGLTRSYYQIDAWAQTYIEAQQLATAIRAAFKNYTGAMGAITVSHVTLDTGPIAVYEDQLEAFRVSQTFSLWHCEG